MYQNAPLYLKKTWEFKAKISKFLHGTTKAKVLCRFSIYIKQITPLENGDQKFALLTPFFLQNTGVTNAKNRKFAWNKLVEVVM